MQPVGSVLYRLACNDRLSLVAYRLFAINYLRALQNGILSAGLVVIAGIRPGDEGGLAYDDLKIVILIRMLRGRRIERYAVERIRIVDAAVDLRDEVVIRPQDLPSRLGHQHLQANVS